MTAVRQFDTHNDYRELVNSKFNTINAGLEGFVKEMKAQGLWDNVVIMTISDFGRKLVPNGRGTDHAWGGRYPSAVLYTHANLVLNIRACLPPRSMHMPTVVDTEGNYFVLGGGIRGGQVLGEFPSRLHPEHNTQDINNGRLIPTTPWEVICSGLFMV